MPTVLGGVQYDISRIARPLGLRQSPSSRGHKERAMASPSEWEVELCDRLNERLGKEMVDLARDKDGEAGDHSHP